MCTRIHKASLSLLWGSILAFVFVALLPAAEPASDPGDDEKKPQHKEEARERWRMYPENKKQELLKKYHRFKSLPDEEKRRLRERHRKLQVIRDTVSPQEKNRAEGDRRIKAFLKQRTEEMGKKMKQFSQLPESRRSEIVRNLRSKLEKLNFQRMDGFLEKLKKEKLITEKEAKKIRSLSHHERGKKILSLGKERLLEAMDGLVPEEEVEALRKLEPWPFHRKVRSRANRWGLPKPIAPLVELTRKQLKKLKQMQEGPEKEKERENFFKENLRIRLEEMGVDRSSIDKALRLPVHEKQHFLLRLLKRFKSGQEGRGPRRRSSHESPDSPSEEDGAKKQPMRERRGRGRRLF